eukprot:Em0003g1876a
MITLETLDDVVTTMGVSSLHKARALLCALQRSFAEQPPSERAANFNRFLDILKKEQALHCIGSRVEATYRETQEPNALNGRSLASSPHEGQPSNHGHQEGAASSGELPAGSSNHSTSDTSSRPTARVQTGRRIAVTTAAPAHELDQAQRPSRRSRPRYHHSRASRSKRPHSAKRKHQGKAAKSSSSSNSSRRSSASSSDRSRHGRHCSHRRRRSSSLEEFLVSPFPTCSATPAKYLVKKIRKGKFTNFDCLLGPGIEEGSNALQLQGKRVGETKASKRRVVDLSSWMEAWTVFLAIRVQTAPQTALQLVKYQAIITQLFLSYPASVCIKYDSASAKRWPGTKLTLSRGTRLLPLSWRKKWQQAGSLVPCEDPNGISGLGAIPKKNRKWRMVLHLSAPHGGSVDDGIHKEQFPVHYATMDNAVDLISRFGTGAIMANPYFKVAFRMVPIHPDDWDLLGSTLGQTIEAQLHGSPCEQVPGTRYCRCISGDIQLVEHVRVRRSKADQWGKGALISIGCSGDKCCPVRANGTVPEEGLLAGLCSPVPIQEWLTTDCQGLLGLATPPPS